MKALVFILVTAFVAGSCACDCFDECDKAINFRFDTSGSNGFGIEEIDTIVVKRYSKWTSALMDSLSLIYDSSYHTYRVFPVPLLRGSA